MTDPYFVLLGQGAEGKIYESTYLGKPSIIKVRVSKRYRVSELDQKINKQRLLQEARCMVRCRKLGILTPSIFFVDSLNYQLHIQMIIGKTVKELLTSYYVSGGSYPAEVLNIARDIGRILAKMHDAEIVHGDLTTSNLMIEDRDPTSTDKDAFGRVVLIDFGLASMKPTIEDKAVDLYVLERAFISTHPHTEHMAAAIIEAYHAASINAKATISRLEQVRMRGRKRDMFG